MCYFAEYSIFLFFNLLLDTSAHTTLKKSYRIIKTNFIKEIQYIGKEKQDEDQTLPSVSISKLVSKENSTIRQLREEAARIGVGVTEEAQAIFDALAKT